MANSLIVNQGQAARMPSAIGLMGGGRRLNSLLPFLLQAQPVAADAADEAMFARAAQGYVETPQGYAPVGNQPSSMAAPVMPQGPAERGRVNPLNVLFRGLAPNLSGALETERARLQAEADRPAQQARLQAVLQNISDPREQALFLGLGGEDWQKNVGQQFAPQVVAPGAVQSINGRAVVGAPQQYEFGDTRRSFNPVTGVDSEIATRGPTIAEQTALDRLAWDQQYGQGRLGVDQYQAQTGRMNADTAAANSGFTIGRDQTRYAPDGTPIVSQAASSGPSPESLASARASIANTRRAIDDARANTNWRTTGKLAGLIPFNQGQEDLQRTADTIEANLSFNALQQMRDASKTGGALGSIAVRELELLGSTIASLKTSQSPEQFRRNLDVIDSSLDRWEAALSQGRSSVPPPPPGFELDR